MKRFLGIVVVLLVLSVVGCRSIFSPCDIILYSANGSVIRQWHNVKLARCYNGIARFMDEDNSVAISGTFTMIYK